MDNAVKLFLEVPTDYFSAIVHPFSADTPKLFVVGILSLIIGTGWGIVRRQTGLLMFLVIPAISQLLVAVAGFVNGTSKLPPAIVAISFWGLVMLQIAGAGYLVWRLKGARWPATALAIFTSSYALLAFFISLVTFTGRI